jgi:uncharacterized protein (UPF0264 family)
MKVLISPINRKEALEAVRGGADIIDIKNPQEGSLGANFPWIIKDVVNHVPKNIETSCTIGEMPALPGSISLAARGAASIGVNYIKAGLCGINSFDSAIKIMKNIVRSVKDYNSKIKVAIVGYADSKKINSIDPILIPQITKESLADISMIDTAVKNGQSTFKLIELKKIKKFIKEAHKYKLKTALAGSLRKEDFEKVKTLNPDVIGIRGAACTKNDRLKGKITSKKVKEIVDFFKEQ